MLPPAGRVPTMELFFKRYFWTVNVLFVLMAALLAAKTVNLVVEASMAPAPSAPIRSNTVGKSRRRCVARGHWGTERIPARAASPRSVCI